MMKNTMQRFRSRARLLCAAIGLMSLTTPLRAATNDLTSLFQQALFEEEANRNFDAALTNYQALVVKFDQNRQVAATATFRLGEIYRKLGRTNDAIAQYERIVRDFSDDQTLATLSRQNLTGLGVTGATRQSTDSSAELLTPAQKEARATQHKLLEQEIQLAEKKVDAVQKQHNVGQVTEDAVWAAQREVLDLKRQLAAVDAGAMPFLERANQVDAKADPEEEELRFLQTTLQNSPDLIKSDPSGQTMANAIAKGWTRVVTFLLDHGTDVNAKSGDRTPLHIAAGNGNRMMVEFLLNHGADIDARDGFGGTALHLAAASGFRAVAEVLLNHKADVNARRNRTNGEITPLGLAVERGHLEMVKLLIDRGADPNARDSGGQTALHVAAVHPNPKLVEVLLVSKADVNARDHNGHTPVDTAKSSRFASDPTEDRDATIVLLRRHGGIATPPNPNQIHIARPSVNVSFPVFTRSTIDWNRFTLLETILNFYLHTSDSQAQLQMSFPDLSRVTVVHYGPGTNETRREINLFSGPNRFDCLKNVPLEFGDVVEIPERRRSTEQGGAGLTSGELNAFWECLKGRVVVTTGDRQEDLQVFPDLARSSIGDILSRSEVRKLLASSDLSQVKVSRRDPDGKTHEWILNCTNPNNLPDLRLRNGDLIAVPTK